MVLAPTPFPNAPSTTASSSSSTAGSRGRAKKLDDLTSELGDAEVHRIRRNEGEAAAYGIYFDDSEYDYMQHMRDLGSGGGEVHWIEATPPQPKNKGKNKQSLADALRERDGDDNDSPEKLLDDDILPSKNLRHLTYQAQQDIPDAIAGFQPDMDPRLREVLEALDDDAYVVDDGEDGEKLFAELAGDGEELSPGEFEHGEEWGDEEDDDGWESDGTEKPRREFKDEEHVPQLVRVGEKVDEAEAAPEETAKVPEKTQTPDEPEARNGGDWMKDFAKFKKDQAEGKMQSRTRAQDDGRSSLWTATTNGGRKKKRKGALTNPSAYSMTSSSLVRTEQLKILDGRFDKVMEEMQEDFDEAGSVSAISTASSVQGPVRSDFEGMLDEFLASRPAGGKGKSKKGRTADGLAQLDEIRKGLGPARLSSRYQPKR